MECKPCGKTFTGEVCYNQHLQSEKHKKKILSFSILNSQSETSQNSTNNVITLDPQSKRILCDVCDLEFNSLPDFQSHSVEPEHAKKVIAKTQESSINCNIISSSNPMDGASNEKPLDKSNLLLSDFVSQRKSQQLEYSKCEVCSKYFSGPEPYKQHMESALHKKKVELQNSPLFSDDGNQSSSVFTCEPCKKYFSGQIPYMQHMTSDIHKKKLQHLKALERFNSDSIERKPAEDGAANKLQPTDTNPFFCRICNTQCSGLAPYQQHLNGAPHLKNASLAQMRNTIIKPNSVERTMALQLQNLMSKQNADVPDGQQHNEVNQDQEPDYILPELAEKLRVISTNELEASIKIFLPDDTINFDGLESKQMQNVVSIDDGPGDNQMEIKEDSAIEMTVEVQENLMNETKAESEIFKVCEICNVRLKNIQEALHHFESIEHFNKKWRSN